jgi:serpin B
MQLAFTESADFSRMTSGAKLMIDRVYHRTFLALDENGTEAAAATGVVLREMSDSDVDVPAFKEVHVDRPFMFAIQHRPSGACLFLGRVTDPR